MTIADSKRTTDTGTKTKHGAEPSVKPGTPKMVTVVRHPASVQTSAETTPTPRPDATAKPKKATYEKHMRELTPVVRLGKKLEANAKRLSKITREVQRRANAPGLHDAAASVTTALAAMLAAATALPDDFKPDRNRKGGHAQIAIGMKVSLRLKVAERYDGIVDRNERENLEIVSVAHRGLISAKTLSGALLVLPRSHVAKREGDVAASASELSSTTRS